MALRYRSTRLPAAACAALALAAALAPVPGSAQDDARLKKLEAEVSALQRKVFPGGDGRFFEPEISTAPEQTPAQPVGTPAASALTDVLARLTSIESQLARLTAASEVNANGLEQVEGRVDKLESDAQLAQAQPSEQPTGPIPLPGGPASSASSNSAAGELAPARPAGTPSGSSGARGAAAAAPPPKGAPQSTPTPERVAAVQSVAKPSTDDPGDDEYVYGYRLWEAGYYPEAQQQLALFLDKYPSHPRVTYARNLLGRAYLDAGNARTAANYFLQNYQADKQAARAPDSLLFLAESMISLKDTNRACIALSEFGDTYPALATGRLQTQYDADRGKITCK